VRALISDIHGNLEALQAVLADIRTQGVKEIYCLGDVIGYGPNPRECIDMVMDCKVALLGNHDQGALFDPEGFNTGAERAIFWTRDQLETDKDEVRRNKRLDWLGELQRRHVEDATQFVHGSPRNPLNEYIFPEDIYNQRKMERLFALVDKYAFVGHTHVPGVFTERMAFLEPDEINYQYTLGDEKLIINVGSVGQPRDNDPRACYVMMNGNKITYRRVQYDFEPTIRKIYDIPQLDNFLGDRLREGR
jgi:predicted phosphodiesterase